MSTPPSRLGSYPIERELGRGGMGVVYLGRDPRLNRPVAIKVLPEALTNAESLARFDREAKLLASLNHPNIATIYGVEEIPPSGAGQPAQRLLVLEYIPGDTLSELLRKRAVPGSRDPGLHLTDTLDICRQIASAIEAAHEGGVIHRDLKPGNVKITPDGQVKVLDFGLAKGTAVSDAELAHSPTMTFAATGMGVILGTAGYMSPEQARGKAVDRRTDIWSFGCVLFECLAGRQIFEGETVSDTIARILEREPDWTALPANIPPQVREVLRRCLEKDLKKRQRDIGDVRIQLEEAIADRASAARSPVSTTSGSNITSAPQISAPKSSRARTVALALTMMMVGAVVGIGLWNVIAGAASSASGTAGSIHASVSVPTAINARFVGPTRDGQALLLVGATKNADGTDDGILRVYKRRIDEDEFKPVAGTEGVQRVSISSDSKWLAIFKTVSPRSASQELVKVSLDDSSPPVRIAAVSDNWREFAWLENGDFIIGLTGGVNYVRLPRNSATPGPEVTVDLGGPGSVSIGSPLPDSRGVFLHVEGYSAKGWLRSIWVLDLTTNKAHRLVDDAGGPVYVQTGHMLFAKHETLMAVPFDLKTLTVKGDPIAMMRGLRIGEPWKTGDYVASQNGTVVSLPGGVVGTERRLVIFDAAGNATPVTPEHRVYETYPSVSQDGNQVAMVIANETGTYEIWTLDRNRPILARSIATANADCSTMDWSPDGTRLVFQRYGRSNDDGVYVQNADGSGSPTLVMRNGAIGDYAESRGFTPDGSGLVVMRSIKGKRGLYYVAFPGSSGELATPKPLRTTSYNDVNGTMSPDGKLLAFESDESGKVEVYVAAWNSDNTIGRPVPVSNGGGAGIDWADRHRVFFGTPDAKIMSSSIEVQPTLTVSTPVLVHDLKKLRINGWNVLPDGRVLAIQRPEAEDDMTTFSVMFNWFDELNRRMKK